MDFEDVLHMHKSEEINREEVFLECENLEMFEINENGEIWKISSRSGGTNRLRAITPKQVLYTNVSGNITCKIGINKHTISAHRSRIIWTKYIGRIPDGMYIIHKNGIYSDDRLENLDIMKHCEVIPYYNEKFGTVPFGENCSSAKLTNEQCLDIYKRSNNGESLISLANEYNITKTNVYYIKKHLTWRKVTPPIQK